MVFPLINLYVAPIRGFGSATQIFGFINVGACLLACCLLCKRTHPNKKAGAAIDLKALADAKYGMATLATFPIEFAVFVPYTYICSYVLATGIDREASYRLNILLNVGAIPGRALPGYAAERFGSFNMTCVTAMACSVAIFALWYKREGNKAATTAFGVVYGFRSGAAISLTPVCIGEVCGVEDYGKRMGQYSSLPVSGRLLMPP